MDDAQSGTTAVGSSLISFTPGMSLQAREDLKHLVLYADFFASQAFNRQVLWKSWLDYYRNRLAKYCTLKQLIVQEPAVMTDSAELERITFEISGERGSKQLAEQVVKSFKAVRANEYASTFFKHGRGAGQLGSFQIVPCEINQSGEIVVLVCAVHITASVGVDVLGFSERVQRDMILRIGGGSYVFDPKRYSRDREMIRAKMSAVALATVRQLDS